MAETHPSDLELLQYVEGELARDDSARIAAHVAACAACGAAAAEATAGRDALRLSGLVEPPRELRRRITADLDRHRPPRRVYVSPMRLVALVAPFAVVLALVSAIAALDLGGGGGDGGGGVAAQADEAEDAGGGAGEAAPEAGADSATTRLAGPVASVAGPPAEVAAGLRARGLDARVEEGRVVVTGATPRAVVRALAPRPRGPVDVVVEP